MKSFKQYLAESVKECYYVIKLATQPSDDQVDAAETYLKKFDLIELDVPVKLENDRIDFSDINNKNVWAIRFVTGMPLSPYIIMQNLKNIMNVPEEYIVVRGANEPVQIEAELSADSDKSEGSSARLSTDRFYDDAEQPQVTGVFGDDYNKRLLDYLANVAATRKSEKYEAPAPLFSWLQMDKAMEENAIKEKDFNERFDTVKPVSKDKGKDVPPIDSKLTGISGNFDDTAATSVKFVKTANGERKVTSGPRAKLKTEKVK